MTIIIRNCVILEFILGRSETSNLCRGQVIKNLNSYLQEATAISRREVTRSFVGYVCMFVYIYVVISSSFIEDKWALEALVRMKLSFVEKCFDNKRKRH